MRTLSEYLADKRKGDFAKSVKISAQYLSQILSGDRVPSLTVAARIERATNGQVLATSFVNIDPPVETLKEAS